VRHPYSCRLSHHSRKIRLYQAFHALEPSITRTCFLLTFISDEKLREVILAANEVERYNAFGLDYLLPVQDDERKAYMKPRAGQIIYTD